MAKKTKESTKTAKQELQYEIESQQLRFKKALYEEKQQIINEATGEILRESNTVKSKYVGAEPAYIKVYFKAMLAVNSIDNLPLDFVLALASNIGYVNSSEQCVKFYNNKAVRKNISEMCLKANGEPISDNMVSRYITEAKRVGLLFETDYRGVYDVNPCMIARGDWEKIKVLQAKFDFTEGKWYRKVVTENPAEAAEQDVASVTEKEQLTGQLGFDDVDMLIVDDEAC